MYRMKKAASIALVATMVMGSSLTAFAADNEGSTQGSGSNEGHVDKEVVNVVLPTIPAGSAPFNYITDPERLIQATAGAKYEDFTFPDKTSDTGLYFLVGEKEYANTSNTLQVINKSSCDVTVTVKVKAIATAGDTDLAFATSSTTTKDNPLFLNLKVGKTDQVVSATEESVAKTIAGNPDNFEMIYKDSAYAYAAKADATAWKALDISMNGAVFAGAAGADTTAPTVSVTWSYAKAEDTATVDTTDQTDYSDGPSVAFTSAGVISVAGLASGQTVTGVSVAYTKDGSQLTDDLLNNQNVTWNADKTSGRMNSNWTGYLQGCGSVTVTVTLSGNVTKTATATF